MDYIVMDLEWNQNPYGKDHRKNQDVNFEIIEIGAVKVNRQLEITDTYKQLVKPRIFKKLHYKIKEITNLTMEELEQGKDFRKAIREFLEWCGDDYIFCTWGSMDLYELQSNMKYYGYERILDYPLMYVDLQKMFSLRYDDGHMKRTLLNAVEYLNIEEDSDFHRALSDAYYTVRVMQEMDFETYKNRLSIDTFYHPRIKEEEIFVRFDNYTKQITREFWSRDEMFADSDVSEMRCNICDRKLKVLVDWYSDSGKTYYGLGKCREHGYVRGKIKVKKADEYTIFGIKIMKSTDREGAQTIIDRQKGIREKRREKRQKIMDKDIFVDEMTDEDEDD